jgi:histidine triad (HIT) family protein
MDKECIFCNIVNGKTDTEFLYKDDTVVAFKDINPHAPVHDLIVPFKHIRSINDVTAEEEKIMTHMLMTGRKIAEQEKVNESGYKLLFNVEWGGGQRIFHVHLHLLGAWDRK